ncbi:MAG TPA: KpsF/GutQ family sugar-phosphate isomerase [Paracoccaceae bacterium]|nr:KpsF/GutQ family sugar-phosphate isomerase [Paracoccaceae bacterium]HMO71817.1 KpsF/GutQ family sugar-phosphate isomerase [Paracoccaceae bacterium]
MDAQTPHQDAIAAGRRVVQTEAAALSAMAEAMPEGFGRAVDLLMACRGRVIASGIGKSGHIARKIAATLSSTGTPAHFVHPSEASHGDLGAITEADACLMLSNSGETAELSDLIAHAKRFGLGLVAITSRPASTLAQAADVALVLPGAPEACPHGLAPTTSTTLALALGDALAVALMQARGFAADHFRAFHPGGRLGARLARVDQLMRGGDLPLVAPETGMEETLLAMTAAGYGIAGVVAGGRLAGVITDGDLRRNMAGLMGRRAGEVATPNPLTCPPAMLAQEAVALMNARKISQLFVVDDAGAPVGILHLHDCLRAGVR